MIEILKKREILISLCIVFAVGTGLRFYDLTQRGIFDYDEAWYLLESKSLVDTISYGYLKLTGDPTSAEGLKDYLRQRGNTPITSFKPGHTVLVFLGLLLFGIQDYATFLLSAVLGVATVWLLYRLGSAMFSRRVGLFAAAFLAASAFHVTYSRSGYAQAKVVFFVALGICLWYLWRNRPERWRNVFAGMAVGYAFTCHFNVFTIPILAAVLEFDFGRRHEWRLRLRRLFDLGAGMAAPLLMFELPARILRWIGMLPDGQLTYYEQYFYRGTLASTVHLSTKGLFAISEKLWITEGPLAIAALFVGAFLLLRQAKVFEHRMLIYFLAIPALPWCLLSSGLPPLFRTFIVLAVPVSLIAGYGIARSLELPALRHACLPVCLVICLYGSWSAAPLLGIRSGYGPAVEEWIAYTQSNGGTIATFPGSSWPIYYFYLSAAYNDLAPGDRDRIRFYPGDKDAMPPSGQFDVVDIKRRFRGIWLNKPFLSEYLDKLTTRHTPVVSVANPAGILPRAFDEAAGTRYTATLEAVRSSSDAALIEIYDLRKGPSYAEQVGKYFQNAGDTKF